MNLTLLNARPYYTLINLYYGERVNAHRLPHLCVTAAEPLAFHSAPINRLERETRGWHAGLSSLQSFDAKPIFHAWGALFAAKLNSEKICR